MQDLIELSLGWETRAGCQAAGMITVVRTSYSPAFSESTNIVPLFFCGAWTCMVRVRLFTGKFQVCPGMPVIAAVTRSLSSSRFQV
jgi:hypothetical protein